MAASTWREIWGPKVVDVQGIRAVNLQRCFIDKEVKTLPSSVNELGVFSSLVSPNLGLVHYLGSSFFDTLWLN